MKDQPPGGSRCVDLFGQRPESCTALPDGFHNVQEIAQRSRQAIERQLNKVELANRFTRAVAVGNPREFTQAEKEEQEVAEACNRLIKNCIICWNYLYLARQLEKAPDAETKENLRRAIIAHAAMAWAHINMLGEYDFSDEKLRDTLGILPLKSVV